jgi:hypothetical protein
MAKNTQYTFNAYIFLIYKYLTIKYLLNLTGSLCRKKNIINLIKIYFTMNVKGKKVFFSRNYFQGDTIISNF